MTSVPEDPGAVHGAALSLPLSPIGADRPRPVAIASTVASALALLVVALTSTASMAPVLVLALVLSLAFAWAWPVLGGSHSPQSAALVLAVAVVPIVLSALREDLRWTAAAVAFGIVLSFFAQLARRSGREGLVLSLLASFGGLVPVASVTSAVVVANEPTGRSVLVVGMAAATAAVLADLLVRRPGATPYLGLVALLASAGCAVLVSLTREGVSPLAAVGIGAAVGTASWSFRRVLALQPAMVTVRGQVAAGIGGVLFAGVLVRLFALVAS